MTEELSGLYYNPYGKKDIDIEVEQHWNPIKINIVDHTSTISESECYPTKNFLLTN